MSGSKAFLDTNIFIYLIEEHPLYLRKIDDLLRLLERDKYEIITSTLTVGEILTKPYKENRLDLIKTYQDFFEEMVLVDLNSDIASLFAKMRAQCGIRTPDAVQIASALYAKADLFVTNDARLRQCSQEGFEVLLLGDV